MYMSIVEKSPQLGYLTFNDISSALTDTDVSESLYGTLDYCNSNSSSPFLSLKDAFNELLAVNGQCLFTMGNSVPCYTTAVMRDENQYYLFDSHSRGDMGLLKPDGAACLTVHQNIDELCIFVHDLAASLKLQDPVPFELASILTQQYSSDCDSNFGGFGMEDFVSDGEYACRSYVAVENIETACNETYSDDVSPITSDTENSDKLNTSELSQCVKGINDSATFINNIDTEFLSGDVGDMSMPLGGRDDSCEDDMRGETDDDVDEMDDDNDEDYVADESGSNSTDSDDIPLAKLRKIKKSKKVKKSKVVDSMVSESGDGCILLPGDDGGSQTGDSINESVSQSGDGHISQSDVSNSQAESSCPISEAAPSQTESLPSQSSMSQSRNPTQPTASRGRKRKREPKTWKRNVAKQRCNSGDSYINKHGVERPGRGMKKPCGTCRNKCSSIYTHENRQNIFHSFWQLGDINKQRQFIANYTEKKPKKTKTSESNRRKSSITWFLPSSNGSKSNKVKVCKTFFFEYPWYF